MYLKSIEVQGFKSFANKILFEFHNGITGIVGPNGSGKSNVADAVRWVLGEQKIKQLRGSSMQDVIFAGTELRKPLSYASVAITMDNSDRKLAIDYNEVTVTRRLYRSGESEYLLNGSNCRLKDIHELFYDTGIGKEGYSIIGQGQIDKILSGKPEERRELFDEAAGIVKFKRRKDTAQKKLESERQNLLRANDILSEIEQRIGPLEQQAETAKLYLKKKEELKSCDINSFLLELEHLRGTMNELQQKISLSDGQFREVSDQYEQTKARYEHIERQLEIIDQGIEETRTKEKEASVLHEQLEGRLNVLREQGNTARLSEGHLSERISDLSANQEKASEQYEENQRALKENKDQLETLISRQEDQTGKLHRIQSQIESLAAQIEHDKEQVIALLNNKATIRAERQKFETMLEQLALRKSELSQKSVLVFSDQEKQDHLAKELQGQLGQLAAEIEKWTNECGAVDGQLAEIRTFMQKQNEALLATQSQYHKDRSRLESLTNLTERYEGYGNSIRRIMEKKKQNPDILGVVADLIHTEKKYETAIETALGGSIQNIVTRDEETAKQMITYLKSNKLGRATFLPLTSIRPQQDSRMKQAVQETGAVALASSLVTTQEEVSAVKEYLLGRILVVDTLNHAIAIAKKFGYAIRIVTLDGELLNPGGSMTGGAFKQSGNLLGRRRELEELRVLTEEERQKITDIQHSIVEKKANRDELRRKLEETKQKLQSCYLRQNTAKVEWNQVSAQIEGLLQEHSAMQKEQEDLDAQIGQLQQNRTRIDEEISTSSGSRHALEQQIEEKQRVLDDLRTQETELINETVQLQMERSGLVQKKEFMNQTGNRLAEQMQVIEQEISQLLEEKALSAEEIQKKEEDTQAVLSELNNTEKMAEGLREDLKNMQAQREKLTGANKSFFQQREDLAERIRLLDKELLRLNSQKERLEEEREKQINYMWDEYELTFSSAQELRNPDLTNLNRLKARSKEIREEIRALGAVNVHAIDEFKETNERYMFLKTQRDDLVQAEKTLLDIIEELDVGMRRQFREKFDQIQVEFDKAFRELFGGGRGTIELVEDEDILEAGIRIISQPPGKKLQNMMQLSGGEKALTAIALLFAIQNLKPSPFCLLDEIEAALDDSNVVRFAKYLHKLTKNTQFIVITHRRGTMTAADRLYGITMQEKGVSTLVSVNLIEESLGA